MKKGCFKMKKVILWLKDGTRQDFEFDALTTARFFTYLDDGKAVQETDVKGNRVVIEPDGIADLQVNDMEDNILFDSSDNYEKLGDFDFTGNDFVQAFKEINVDFGRFEALKEELEEKYKFLKLSMKTDDDSFELDEFIKSMKKDSEYDGSKK